MTLERYTLSRRIQKGGKEKDERDTQPPTLTKRELAWPGERHPVHQEVMGSIPGQGTAWVVGSVLSRRCAGGSL